MKVLASLKAEDVDPDAPDFDYGSFKPRQAARAVVFDERKVALIYIEKHGYYMLPGGGVENEDIVTGLYREITEELGCEIEVIGEIGTIKVYFDRWSKKQTDTCFIANKTSSANATALTNFEITEGHKVVWAKSPEEAIRLVENADPINRDGKLVRARDLIFLKNVSVRSRQ